MSVSSRTPSLCRLASRDTGAHQRAQTAKCLSRDEWCKASSKPCSNRASTPLRQPGTSEMHFVAALDQSNRHALRAGLAGAMVTGMADGYYRIKEALRPRCVHYGPGLRTGLQTCTTRGGRTAASSTSSAIRPPITARLMRRSTADTEGLARSGVRLGAHQRTCGERRPRRRRCRGRRHALARANSHADFAVRHVVGRRRRGG